MAKRKIVWSHRAKIRLYEILDFYIKRNKSTTYSKKLNKILQKGTRVLLKYPEIGLKTTEESTRGLIIDTYVIYYQITDDKIIIHTIWDSRQDPASKVVK